MNLSGLHALAFSELPRVVAVAQVDDSRGGTGSQRPTVVDGTDDQGRSAAPAERPRVAVHAVSDVALPPADWPSAQSPRVESEREGKQARFSGDVGGLVDVAAHQQRGAPEHVLVDPVEVEAVDDADDVETAVVVELAVDQLTAARLGVVVEVDWYAVVRELEREVVVGVGVGDPAAARASGGDVADPAGV